MRQRINSVFPCFVAPPTSRCGIWVRSAYLLTPWVSIPSGIGNFISDLAVSHSGVPSISCRSTILRSVLSFATSYTTTKSLTLHLTLLPRAKATSIALRWKDTSFAPGLGVITYVVTAGESNSSIPSTFNRHSLSTFIIVSLSIFV